MRPFTDYETTQEYTDFQKLPAGAFEIEIIRAEDTDKALCLLFDIRDGEFDGYYRKKFEADRKSANVNNPKFKGVFRLWYPDGGQYDDNKKRRMKTALKLIKEENHLNVDFSREWDGAALKGARIGMIFRSQEYDYQGKRGFAAQPFTLISLENLREGNFTIPEPKTLSGASQPSYAGNPAGFAEIPADDDLPF